MIDQTSRALQNTPDPQAELLSAVDDALSEMCFDDFLSEFEEVHGEDHNLIWLREDPGKIIGHALARRLRAIALDYGFEVNDVPLTELCSLVEKHAVLKMGDNGDVFGVVMTFDGQWNLVSVPYGMTPIEHAMRCSMLNPIPCDIPPEAFHYPPALEMAEATARLIREMCTGKERATCFLSIRSLMDALGVSKSTADRVLDSLQSLGVIVCVRKGGYGKGKRLASEWRYVEHGSRVALPPKRKAWDTGVTRVTRDTRDSRVTGSHPTPPGEAAFEKGRGRCIGTPSGTGTEQGEVAFSSAFTRAAMGTKCKARDYVEVAGVALRFALSRSDGYAFSESDVPSVAAAARATGNPIVALEKTTLRVLRGQITISGPSTFIEALEAWQG